MPKTDLLTLTEAAAWLRVSTSTLRAMCERGEIAHVRVGSRGQYRFHLRALEDHVFGPRDDEKE